MSLFSKAVVTALAFLLFASAPFAADAPKQSKSPLWLAIWSFHSKRKSVSQLKKRKSDLSFLKTVNVKKDMAERHNVIKEHPEVAKRLTEVLKSRKASLK